MRAVPADEVAMPTNLQTANFCNLSQSTKTANWLSVDTTVAVLIGDYVPFIAQWNFGSIVLNLRVSASDAAGSSWIHNESKPLCSSNGVVIFKRIFTVYFE